MNYNAIYICGTDEYGTATEIKAIEEGMTPKEICDKYHTKHKAIYEWFDIDTELFGRTSTPKHETITQEIYKGLRDSKNTFEQTTRQQFCEKCDRFLADRFVAGTCPHCGYDDARGDQCDKCGKLIDAVELKDPKCKVNKTCQGIPIIKESKHIFIDLAKIKPDLQKWCSEQSKEWSSNARVFTEAYLK